MKRAKTIVISSMAVTTLLCLLSYVLPYRFVEPYTHSLVAKTTDVQYGHNAVSIQHQPLFTYAGSSESSIANPYSGSLSSRTLSSNTFCCVNTPWIDTHKKTLFSKSFGVNFTAFRHFYSRRYYIYDLHKIRV